MKQSTSEDSTNPDQSPAAASSEPAAGSPSTRTASRGSLGVIFLTVFIDLLGFGIVLPLLPIYAKSFGTDVHGVELGLLMASFSLMQFMFAPAWGRLSDRIGRRPVLMVGLAGSVIFYMLFGIATVYKSLTLLFVSRIGAGIAGATISTAQAYIADTTTVGSRNKGMALIGAAFGLGFTLGPIFAYFALPSGEGEAGPGPGYVAAALSAVAFLLAIFKLPESLDPAHVPPRHSRFSLTALQETLSVPSIGLLLLTSLLCVVAFGGFETTLSLFLKDEKGPFKFTFGQVCWTFAFIGVTLAFVQGGIVRRLAGKVSETALGVTGLTILFVGLFGLSWAHEAPSSPMLFVGMAVCVTGFAFVTPSLNSLISRRSDPARQGSVLGTAQSVSALGRILGPLIGIPLFAMISPIAPLLAGAGLILLAMFCWLAASKRGQDFPGSSDPGSGSH